MSGSDPPDGSLSDNEEYWSAEEELTPLNEEVQDLGQPVADSIEGLGTENMLSTSRDDEVYWTNVPDFDFDDDALTSLLSSPTSSLSTFSPNASTSAPLNSNTGQSLSLNASSSLNQSATVPLHSNTVQSLSLNACPTLYVNGTSYSISAHPLTDWHTKKRYYVITKGRAIGIFDNWLIVKAYTDGINAAHQKAWSVYEAWRIYDMARELSQLEIIQ
ncbi:hypothetical protein BDN70DRAFT_940016 [Pholiota conissans]|uniref:Ribonuclease H1 N-terminal domain-containing protein n=1 Tax=Pholiota conissans TaxID=109636 RepID=A0A9P6CQE6_9AGAR|nr:hypothetical protein BDN70DRAFT_940016 [Pholiota conissans]